MTDQRPAILRLLADDDLPTTSLVLRKVAETESLAAIRELRAMASGPAATHLDSLIAEITDREAESAFSRFCENFDENGDIEEANWLLAATFTPGIDFAAQRRTLDLWGGEVAGRLAKVLTRAERVRVLGEYLGRTMRLRGNDDDYYNLDNSLLPRVIDKRLGIPITLSLIYLLVGRRAGLSIEGVGLPGHFLARHEDVFFDPFHGGRRVTLDECSALMEQQNLVLTPQHLLPTTPKQMLIRTLTNISFITEQSKPAIAGRVTAWLDLLRQGAAERG